MFSTEFAANEDGSDVGVIFFTWAPFGFTGSPGIFGRAMQGVKWIRPQFCPDNPLWEGILSFWCEIFVGDGMFLEARIGTRAAQSVAKWEWAATQLLGSTAVSAGKLAMGGIRGKELAMLGSHVNLESDEISLPGPELVGAYNLVHQAVFNPGNYTIPLQAIQEFRGCMNHWRNTRRLWRRLVELVNQLLGKTDTAILWIRCIGPEKWLAFRYAIQYPREVATGESD